MLVSAWSVHDQFDNGQNLKIQMPSWFEPFHYFYDMSTKIVVQKFHREIPAGFRRKALKAEPLGGGFAGNAARAGGADGGCRGAIPDKQDATVGGGADLIAELDAAA